MGTSTVRFIVIDTGEALWIVLQPLHLPVPTEQSLRIVAEHLWQLRWIYRWKAHTPEMPREYRINVF